jgi:hypothetical protein
MVFGSLSDAASAFKEGLGGSSSTHAKTNFDLFYDIRPNDWYKTYPFYFEIKKGKDTVATFYLPIPPQQMSLQQVTTSEAYPTIGGVVTEVSPPVFYMITMSGTTGMSLNANGVSNPGSEVKQRQTFDDLAGGPGIGAKYARSLANNIESLANIITPEENVPFFKYGSAVSTLKEGISDNDAAVRKFESITGTVSKTTIASAVAKIAGKMARAFIGNIYDNKKASIYVNGFAWEHGLKQFFLIYQRERGNGAVDGLYFIDAKNNNRYACVPKNVQFTKSVNIPYVSQYTIGLKCWSDVEGGKLNISDDKTAFHKIAAGNRFEGDLSEAFTVSAAAAITSFYRTRVKLARYKDIGGAMARDAGGSTF